MKCLLSCLLIAGSTLLAQSPMGTIVGTVTDPTGAVIPGTRITIVNRDTGLRRVYITEANGAYSAAALLSGVYHVTAEAAGFRLLERTATVEAGDNHHRQSHAPTRRDERKGDRR